MQTPSKERKSKRIASKGKEPKKTSYVTLPLVKGVVKLVGPPPLDNFCFSTVQPGDLEDLAKLHDNTPNFQFRVFIKGEMPSDVVSPS